MACLVVGLAMEEPDDPPAATAADSSPTSSASDGSPSSERSMATISRHYFGGDCLPKSHDFYIDIIENMREDYGMFLWPCSVVLAEYVWQQRSRFSGASVIELGAGTSLPGLVAAKLGANVVLTDNSNQVAVLENMSRACDLNKLYCKVLGFTWGVWDESAFDLQPQIVLGADVLYDTIDFDDLFATVAFLLRTTAGSVFITTYHNRSGHHLIEFLMVKWGLKCSKLLDGYSLLPTRKASSLQGSIQLIEIMMDNHQTS